MRNALFAVVGLLALSFVPVSGHAQMPGDKCGGADKVQVGTTKIATDSQNIIACLLTGNTAPGANVSEWKAMTSSNNGGSSGGNGGITGGCNANISVQDMRGFPNNYERFSYLYVDNKWGNGCDLSKNSTNIDIQYDQYGEPVLPNPCKKVQASGYTCGYTYSSGQTTTSTHASISGVCVCLKG